MLVDRVIDAGYELNLYTSADFSFPSSTRRCSRACRRRPVHEGQSARAGAATGERGRDLAAIDSRDPARPFFAFMFFESPHAPYTFPEECTLKPALRRRPQLPARWTSKKDIGAIKNRYINACRHLDTQLDRVFKYLEQKNLLDSTIVLVTGDHGEEFMEKGRWGHHSAFSEEQIRVPLILHVPGVAPAEIDRMTCHLDLPATILPRLGVKNPPEDYCLGATSRRTAARVHDGQRLDRDGVPRRRVQGDLPGEVLQRGAATVTTRDDVPRTRRRSWPRPTTGHEGHEGPPAIPVRQRATSSRQRAEEPPKRPGLLLWSSPELHGEETGLFCGRQIGIWANFSPEPLELAEGGDQAAVVGDDQVLLVVAAAPRVQL